MSTLENKNSQQDSAIAGKVNIAQGVENAGKMLGINNEGNVIVIDNTKGGIINISDTVIPITLDLSPIECDFDVSVRSGSTNFSKDVFVLNDEVGSIININMPEITLGFDTSSKQFVESQSKSISVPITIDRVIRDSLLFSPSTFTVEEESQFREFITYARDLITSRFMNKRIIEPSINVNVNGVLQFTVFPDVGLDYMVESFKFYTKLTIDNGQITNVEFDETEAYRTSWNYKSRFSNVSKIRFITTQDTYATLNATYKNIETIL